MRNAKKVTHEETHDILNAQLNYNIFPEHEKQS